MKKISKEQIQRWRVEIQNAEKFRDEQFGKNADNDTLLSGENIGYYDMGVSKRFLEENNIADPVSVFNVIGPIVDNIIPTLSSKEPYIVSLPKRRNEDDQMSAPIAGEILNYHYKELGLKGVNKDVIFDGYVLGMGVSKIGYTTKFGTVPTEETIEKEKKDREKSKFQKIKESLGLSKPKKEETRENPELNEFIRSESPFVSYVNPYRFGIDPRATCIEEANFVFEEIPKRLSDVKKNKTYKNTEDLKGEPLDQNLGKNIPETEVENFKIVILYEIHYKTEDGINILTLAKNEHEWQALRHDESIYEMDGFQYELITFNKHRHRLYPISDITKIRGLQDRIQQTLENILEQVDKYVPKLFVDETGLTVQGKASLETGGIGANVYTNKNPNEVVKEASFTQLKGDLVALIDKVLEIMMLMTGLTKAQLLGITQAQTATEAQIGQGGMNLRLAEKSDIVSDFQARQVRKLWQVEQQFVAFEEIDLITGEQSIDPNTNLPRYSWVADIDSDMSEKLSKGEYRFLIEVGNVEKPDLPMLRKSIENFVNILGGPGVLQAIAAQGWKIELVEIIREYMKLHPNMFKVPGKIIKPIQNPMQAGLPPQATGGAVGAVPGLLQNPPPNNADIISAAAGEKGAGAPMA
ncbi:hypothetical protein KKF61_08030 [Patescibacteria group bacterium]|nr:hypothetical protein [Patescibacteria group bacterium]